MSELVFGLENVEETNFRKVEELPIITVKSLFGAEANYVLATHKLSDEEKEKIETIQFFTGNNGKFKRLPGIGHGWFDENGNELSTCVGRVKFSVTAPGFILMEHNIPEKGKEYTLYMDELFHELNMEIDIQNRPDLSKLCNTYRREIKKDENTITQKAYDKKARQLKSGKISHEQFIQAVEGKTIIGEEESTESIPNSENISEPKEISSDKTIVHEETSSKEIVHKSPADIGFGLIKARGDYEKKLLELYEAKSVSNDIAIAKLKEAISKAREALAGIETANAKFAVEKARLIEDYERVVSAIINN